MVARIVTFQLQPGKVDEMAEIAADSVIPLMQQQVGCKLITFVSDGEANKALAIGYWDSAADVQANEQSGTYQEQLNKVKHLLAAPPLRELFEVRVQTAPI
jgi:quinol monooxygenase YgiN